MAFESFITKNSSKSLVRNDSMEGREYIVVPVVMMVEGVLNGSCGPLLYPAEEMAKIPQVWNYKPSIVYHPDAGSACTPEILTSSKIGVIMNTVFEDSKLKAECWLEKERCEAVDKRILTAVENKEMLELSTGLFTDNEATEGEWNGVKYVGIARNYRPDHLAILPDQIGACSIKDGAGFLRLNTAGTQISFDVSSIPQLKGGLPPAALQRIENLIINEMGFSDVRDAISKALMDGVKGKDEYVWVVEVYDDYFIFEKKNRLFKQSYTKTKDVVEINGIPLEVVRKIDYVSINERTIEMDKKKIVANLIANKSTQWEEKDEAALMAMDEAVLAKMTPVENTAAPVPATEVSAIPATVIAKPETVVENTAAPVIATVDDYIAQAPAEMKAVLNSGLQTYRRQRQQLIASITTNSKLFTAEELQTKTTDDLIKINTLCKPVTTAAPQPRFDGQFDPDVAVGNAMAEEALPIPVMTYDSK